VCAIENEKSLDCGSKEGKKSCCTGLVCHEIFTWLCVKEEDKKCAGPKRFSKSCKSDWMDAPAECCEGLVCGDDTKCYEK